MRLPIWRTKSRRQSRTHRQPWPRLNTLQQRGKLHIWSGLLCKHFGIPHRFGGLKDWLWSSMNGVQCVHAHDSAKENATRTLIDLQEKAIKDLKVVCDLHEGKRYIIIEWHVRTLWSILQDVVACWQATVTVYFRPFCSFFVGAQAKDLGGQ